MVFLDFFVCEPWTSRPQGTCWTTRFDRTDSEEDVGVPMEARNQQLKWWGQLDSADGFVYICFKKGYIMLYNSYTIILFPKS